MVQQHDDEMGEIKKGPWKEEEDQVLIKHVNKYGPRDWSSIRSKGLLRRTGKSCRLRWVNKLRPHLKTYVHINHFLVCNYVRVFNESDEISFSVCVQWSEVFSGRGENSDRSPSAIREQMGQNRHVFDRKNRQRRQEFLEQQAEAPREDSPHFHTTTINHHHRKPTQRHYSTRNPCISPSSLFSGEISHSTYHNQIKNTNYSSFFPYFQATHEESVAKSQSFQEDLFYPGPLIYGDTPLQLEKKPFSEQQSDLPLQLDSQDLINKLGDPGFLDDFHNSSESVLATTELPIMPSFFGPDRICEITGRPESSDAAAINCMIDDFPPIDMFDHIEPLPSPSQWS